MSTPSYFGRAWKIKITPQSGTGDITVSNSDWDTEALKCTFEIDQQAIVAYWFADIRIYNWPPSMSTVIQKGDLVTVEAGYQSPGSGLIWKGKVYQPIWEREGETDYKLTLHCFIGLFEDETGQVQVTLGSNANPISQGDAVRKVAGAAGILVDYLDPSLDNKLLPRGESFSGRASSYFLGVAADNHMNCWIGPNGVVIRSLAPQTTAPSTQGQTIGGIALPGAQSFQQAQTTPDVIYAPPFAPTSQTDSSLGITKYTLIGTPQQTEQGAFLRVLLDPKVQLGQLIKIDQALLKKVLVYPGQLPPILNQDGTFVVAGICHRGDTRGNEWYTEITGVTPAWSKLFAAQAQ